jgi:hypothetical protein
LWMQELWAGILACKSGVEYRVSVTVFAENSAGRDTRSKTVYVTGK